MNTEDDTLAPRSDPFELSDTAQFEAPPYDPYLYLAEARRKGPVQEEWPLPDDIGLSPKGQTVINVLGYDEVVAALRDNETYSSSILSESMGPLLGHTIVAMDEPEHGSYRALVAPAFRPKILEKWEEALISRVVSDLIDSFALKHRVDLVRCLSFPFPVRVISRILGLPEQDSSQFQRRILEVVSTPRNHPRGMAAYAALREYFDRLVAQRRTAPRDDLITDLVQVEIDGRRLSDEDIFAFLKLLLPAGMENTYRSLGNLLFALLTHPDQLDAVVRHTELRSSAIEESLRWQPSLLTLRRRSVRPSVLGGVHIPPGTTMNVFTGSANRDEKRFTDPDRFDIRRTNNAHVGFGSGVHACLGMHLARMEIRVALGTLLDRFPDLRLDSEAPPPEIIGLRSRSPNALPVCLRI
jgi:cytochrome P450